MNRLKGRIEEVKVNGNLSQVRLLIGENISINSIIIETPATAKYLHKGTRVNVIFKETEVILAKGNPEGISLINQIPGKIKEVKEGNMLCEIGLSTAAGSIQAIISRDAFDLLQLQTGDQITAMVKLNEVMIGE